MSLTSSVERIVSIKEDIRQAIEAKGVSVSITEGMSTYPSYIAEITGGTTPVTLISKVITSNGIYNATDDDADGYSSVEVSVAGSGSGDSMDKYFTRTLESITDTYGSYTVATRGVFQNQSMLSYVSLPNCSTVYSMAFANCTELLEVHLSNSISLPIERPYPTVGYQTFSNSSTYVSGVFSGCYKLQVPPPLSAFSYVPSWCFAYCSALSSITLNMSDLVTDTYMIGANAFLNCSNLHLYINGDENDIVNIYERAFNRMGGVHLSIGKINNTYVYTNYYFFSGTQVWAEIFGSVYTQVSSYTFQNAYIKSLSMKYVSRVQNYGLTGAAFESSYYLPRLNYIVSYGLNNGFSNIELCSLPLLATVQSYGLAYCKYSSVSFPRLSSVLSYGMYMCSYMNSAYLPNLIGVASSAFYGCSTFTRVSLPKASFISAFGLFTNSYKQRTYIFAYPGVVTLNASLGNIFGNVGNAYYNFYVPSSLVDSYKVANQWSVAASKIFALETLRIGFKYNSSTYSTNWGTTWGDWISSADNTDGFYADGNAVYSPEHTVILGATPTTKLEDDEYIWTDKYFTIDGVKYPLPYSMEWIDWIGQLYNPDIPVPAYNSNVVSNSANSPIYDGNTSLVNCYNYIAESSAYTTTI